MKVSGFSFIKNAVKFDFPIVEAITSILPVCDEFVIAVGNSDDATLDLIKSINSPKIKIIETFWDDSLREGGRVLAVETDKAFDAVSPDSDWAFYIQGDEVVHDKYLPEIKKAMEMWKDNPEVEGLLFSELHFYGTYDYVANSRKWADREIRIIRNDKSIRSYMDAMSFRKDGRKLQVKKIDAAFYHYGWVKPPDLQLAKMKSNDRLWHNDNYIEERYSVSENEFDYSKIDSLKKFDGTHPKVMGERIKRANWHFEFDPTKAIKLKPRLRILNFIYQKTGINIGAFKNYKKI